MNPDSNNPNCIPGLVLQEEKNPIANISHIDIVKLLQAQDVQNERVPIEDGELHNPTQGILKKTAAKDHALHIPRDPPTETSTI